MPASSSSTGRRSISIYGALLRRWVRMAGGRSYWHPPQLPGRHFVAGRLQGYFKDYRTKTEWDGESDAEGIPLLRLHTGEKTYFPTTVLQMALGHWERSLDPPPGSDPHRSSFLRLARWIRDTQDRQGGWPLWPPGTSTLASPYSAMTQGQAISVLVRAHALSEEEAYLAAARRSVDLMLTPIEAGGVGRAGARGLILEEYPALPPRTVLNGWTYALFGLYDGSLADPGSDQVAEALRSSVLELVDQLPRFDAGYWSRYDDGGTLASPGYHDLHIVQLQAMETTFPETRAQVQPVRVAFESYRRASTKRLRALVTKTFQKLRRPPDLLFR